MDEDERKINTFHAGKEWRRYTFQSSSRGRTGRRISVGAADRQFRRDALLGWVMIIYCYFRMFSRNVSKRYAENEAFLAGVYKIRNFFRSQKGLWKQRKVYHIYKCPGCRQKIRIPKGKGKIEIRCPKCGTTFIKKS